MRHKQTPYEQYKILLERSLTRNEDPLSSTSGTAAVDNPKPRGEGDNRNDAQRMATEMPTSTRQAEQIQRDLRLAVQQADARQKRSEKALRNDLKELFENSCRVRGRQLRSTAKGHSRTALEAIKEIVEIGRAHV